VASLAMPVRQRSLAALPPRRVTRPLMGDRLMAEWVGKSDMLGLVSAPTTVLPMNDDFFDQGTVRTSVALAMRSEGDVETDDFVRAVIAGQTWAERKLFQQYAPMVHSTLRRCLGPASDIDDLMQEVFLRVFDRVKTLRDLSALRSFVYTIAVRVARTDIRRIRIRRRSEALDVQDVATFSAVSADPEARDTLTRVQASLDGMKTKHRIAFVLRHLDGLSVCEVARELEVSVATVNRWLSRAVQHIHKEIGRDTRLSSLLDKEGSA
jgi:RNA polymerase sigma-70 factor (ECF subfamily)